MVILKTLDEVISTIQKSHSFINYANGVFALKMYRLPNGNYVPIEQTPNLQIKNFVIFNDTTLIVTFKTHQFKTVYSNKLQPVLTEPQDSVLYMPDLTMINIYDNKAEFISSIGMCFSYSNNTKDAKVIMMAEMVHDVVPEVRAQWMSEDIDSILLDIGVEKIRVEHRPQSTPMYRNLDLD